MSLLSSMTAAAGVSIHITGSTLVWLYGLTDRSVSGASEWRLMLFIHHDVCVNDTTKSQPISNWFNNDCFSF